MYGKVWLSSCMYGKLCLSGCMYDRCDNLVACMVKCGCLVCCSPVLPGGPVDLRLRPLDLDQREEPAMAG